MPHPEIGSNVFLFQKNVVFSYMLRPGIGSNVFQLKK